MSLRRRPVKVDGRSRLWKFGPRLGRTTAEVQKQRGKAESVQNASSVGCGVTKPRRKFLIIRERHPRDQASTWYRA